ncbi:MAG TPA: pseudouridine-5'-phosphate glycosidase, partial [Deinococcales bacterium]|nr:pseudouridine-5'-phosphate glycosidase [Deinococcales bacterium]
MTQTIVHPRVRAALDAGDPVVALESTVITHGLPHPFNLETARMMEAAVSEAGALPATIALIGGKVHVGLDDETLEQLAWPRPDIPKVSLWNLP